jgi:hypothetical protein
VKAPLQVALAPPAPKELEAAAKTYQARTIASTLMDRRRLIALEEFDMLLQCADGVIDRLLARLQKLLKQGSRFDNPLHLGAEIRTMVLVR